MDLVPVWGKDLLLLDANLGSRELRESYGSKRNKSVSDGEKQRDIPVQLRVLTNYELEIETENLSSKVGMEGDVEGDGGLEAGSIISLGLSHAEQLFLGNPPQLLFRDTASRSAIRSASPPLDQFVLLASSQQ